MNRRGTISALLAFGAAGGLLSSLASAQTAARPYRIAILPDLRPALEPLIKVFADTLRQAGHIEGRDFVFYRSGVFYGDDADRAVRLVVDAKPDLIFGFNLGYIIAAHKLTKTIPIVMWVSGFPVEGGVAESLAHPGKNVTGLTIYAGAEVFGKLVQLLREVRPGIKRVGALCSYVPPFHPAEEAGPIIREMNGAGVKLGIEVRVFEISKPEQVDDALVTVAAERMDALLLTGGASMFSRRKQIMQFAIEKRLPTIVDSLWFGVNPSPLLSYGATLEILVRQATVYVEKILWGGAKPADLPIELPRKIDLTVDLKTARAIGLAVPESIMLRADKVFD